MTWRVLATQEGHYNQILRQPGEVFDLLCYADGSYPPAYKYTPKKDAAGKDIPDEYDESVVLVKGSKEPVHRDFAEDQGAKTITRGPIKGDTIRFGWMKRVPDRTPIGAYPPNTNFWSNQQLPQPLQVVPDMRDLGPQDRRRNHAVILETLPKEEAA